MAQEDFVYKIDHGMVASVYLRLLFEQHFRPSHSRPFILSFEKLNPDLTEQMKRILRVWAGKNGYYRTDVDGAERVIQISFMSDGRVMLRHETDPKYYSDYEGEHPPI